MITLRCIQCLLCSILALPLTLVGEEAATRADGVIAFEQGNYGAAEAAWLPLARQGDADAQFRLAGLYDRGLAAGGIREEEAFMWYEKAAQRGHRDAAFQVGSAYKHGRGTRPKEALAVYWWQKAAALGSADAQFNLALQYYRGWGVAQDKDNANQYFNLAARNGNRQAQKLVASGKIPRLEDDQLPRGMILPGVPEAVPSAPQPQGAAPGADQQGIAPRPTEAALGQFSVADAPQSETRQQAASPFAAWQKEFEEQPTPPVKQKLSVNWLGAQTPQHFCVQLAVTSNRENIAPFLQKHGLSAKVKVASIERGGQVYHYLLLGNFTERSAAVAAIEGLPQTLRQLKPWPRRFGELQALGKVLS